VVGRIVRLPIELIRVLVHSVVEFYRGTGLHWAAALSFTTLLALVPVGILGFALLGAFENLVDFQGEVENLLFDQGLPEAAEQAGAEIRSLIDRSSRSSTGFGLVGVGFLLVTAMGLYAALERSFNRIWRIRRNRSPLQRFRSFWLVMTLGPVLFTLSVYVTARLQALPRPDREGTLGTIVDAAIFAIPFVTTGLAFFLFYVWLPNTKVRKRSALLGAMLAGAGWEAAKWGFNAYVSNFASFDRIYGALGMIPVFILWIYLTWIIVLFGVEISFVHQNLRAVSVKVAGRGAERGATGELSALGLLMEVYRPFREGEPPPDLGDLTTRLVIRSDVARRILRDLEAAKLLRRDKNGLWLPAREPGRVTLAEAVAAVRGLSAAVAEVWATPAGKRLIESFDGGEEHRTAALMKITLADVLDAEDAK
jgi:membrane protein